MTWRVTSWLVIAGEAAERPVVGFAAPGAEARVEMLRHRVEGGAGPHRHRGGNPEVNKRMLAALVALAGMFVALRPYGFLVLYALMFTGALSAIVMPPSYFLIRLLLP